MFPLRLICSFKSSKSLYLKLKSLTVTIILLFTSEGKKTLCRDLVRSCQDLILRSQERKLRLLDFRSPLITLAQKLRPSFYM